MSAFFENECGYEAPFPLEEVYHSSVEAVLKEFNCPFETQTGLTLLSKEGIKELNREYRGIDKVTDVLSFPLLNFPVPGDFSGIKEDDPASFDPENKELLLGDIAICMERAEEQAEEYGHSLKREYAFLITHSVLHLLGFDHESKEDEEIMIGYQKKILKDTN